MDSEGRRDHPQVARDDGPPESDVDEAGRDVESAPAADAARPPDEGDVARGGLGGGLRLLAAAVMAPWLVGYGVTGAWAVTRGLRAAADGLSSIDVGYSRPVTPSGVIFVGVLLLAGFAVLLVAAMLVLYDARGRGAWAAVCVTDGRLDGRVGVGRRKRRPPSRPLAALLRRARVCRHPQLRPAAARGARRAEVTGRRSGPPGLLRPSVLPVRSIAAPGGGC